MTRVARSPLTSAAGRLAASVALTLALVGGLLPGPWTGEAQAAVPPGETLQDYAARGGVQASAENLSMPAPGVSRVHLDAGQMNGYKVRGAVPTTDEATLTYRVYVPRETHDNGLSLVDLKMPGLAGSPTSQSPWYASSGGDLQSDSFSIRLHARKSSSSSVGYPWWDAYIYAPYAAGKTFSTWGIPVAITSGMNGSGERMRIPVDRWFDVKIHVRLNTPGVNDGLLDIWIDGQQGIKLSDVQWRRAGVTTPLNLLMAETFYNNPGAPKDGHIDFADFVVTPGPAGSTGAAPTQAVPTGASGLFVPVGPVRVHDQRAGVDPGTVTCVQITGAAAGVPADATGVSVNVTTVNPGIGHVVVYPDLDGTGRTPAPTTATVNFAPGRDVANAALVQLPPSGRVCYLVRGSRAGVILDVTGYTRAGSGVTMTMPTRLEDRSGVASGSPVTVQVAGRAGVPAGATAVLLNVGGANSSSVGNLRLWAAGTAKPGTSTLNYAAAGDRSSAAIVQLSAAGALTYESQTATGAPVRVVLDVVGYVSKGGMYVPVTPSRLLDTRAGAPLAAGQRTSVSVAAAGVPAGATGVVLNVVGVGPGSVGNLRVFPYRVGSSAVPSASTLNYIPLADVGNMVITGIGDDRRVALYTDQPAGGRTHAVVDLVGYLAPPA